MQYIIQYDIIYFTVLAYQQIAKPGQGNQFFRQFPGNNPLLLQDAKAVGIAGRCFPGQSGGQMVTDILGRLYGQNELLLCTRDNDLVFQEKLFLQRGNFG